MLALVAAITVILGASSSSTGVPSSYEIHAFSADDNEQVLICADGQTGVCLSDESTDLGPEWAFERLTFF